MVNIVVSDSEGGSRVKADLQKLIDSVWIRPQSPPGFREQVEMEIVNCGLGDVKIHQSP